jgi:hypothetical protein
MSDLTASDDTSTGDELFRRAPELGRRPDRSAAVDEVVKLCDGDRATVEAVRDRYARLLHGDSDNWDATAALNVLNPALAALGWDDRYDWSRRRKP